jgi:hypothetical protein
LPSCHASPEAPRSCLKPWEHTNTIVSL